LPAAFPPMMPAISTMIRSTMMLDTDHVSHPLCTRVVLTNHALRTPYMSANTVPPEAT
jgi:hypothetical protein